MKYTFFQRLTGERRILLGELTPRCDTCRRRTQRQDGPKLFLLPVYHDHHYTPSAEYYGKVCRPIAQLGDIPVGQRACRMWTLVCPECGARAVLVVDFLRVRGQEVMEEIAVCDYPPLAGLLRGLQPENPPQAAPKAQSSTHSEVFRNNWR